MMKKTMIVLFVVCSFMACAPGSKPEPPSAGDVAAETEKTTVEAEAQSTEKVPEDTITVNGVSFVMVKVEAGTFIMGATPEMQDSSENQKPVHQVTITKDFYIGKTEVTNALWVAVMGYNPSNVNGDNKPVDYVTWNNCQEFIEKLNACSGMKFRLPTEAEWEFAARGGNKSRHYRYSGSNNIDNVAWYCDNSGDTTHDVATKQPNELGIYDMSGNMAEWCQDWYGSYSSSPQTDPAGPDHGERRVSRGGDAYSYAHFSHPSVRSGSNPDFANYQGLRLALTK
jgi:formylglycine-generating enzyme required for sulfatase activity